MDLPQRIAVPEKRRDAIRAWAEMEGKSPLMVEDLCLRLQEPSSTDRRARLGPISSWGKAVATAMELWRLWSSR